MFVFPVTSRNNRIRICLCLKQHKVNLFNEEEQFYALKIRWASESSGLIFRIIVLCETSMHRHISQVAMTYLPNAVYFLLLLKGQVEGLTYS